MKLNTNENPYPPSPKVVEAVQAVLTQQADALRLYPDPDATALKQAIAKQQNIEVSQVFVGNGSDEVLAHIFKAFFFKMNRFCIQISLIVFIQFTVSSLEQKLKKFHSMKILR